MTELGLLELGVRLGTFFVPFLFALCFHEYAHGLVAKWRGDRTAEMAGRLSMNPMVHADPLGTFMLPIVSIVSGSPLFFGWAKPVPVNERNLKRPTQDMFWVALAGPLSNVLLAVVGAIVFGLLMAWLPGASFSGALRQMLQTFISINVFLAVFNMIPIHPLDGGKVVAPFLSYSANRWLEENQTQLNLGLMFGLLLFGSVLAVPVIWIANKLLYVSALVAFLAGA